MIDTQYYVDSELMEMNLPPDCECLSHSVEEGVYGDLYLVCEECRYEMPLKRGFLPW